MDLLEDLKMSLLYFSFVLIYIIHTILVFLKNHLNYLKDKIFECFFKSIKDVYYFLKTFFFARYNDRKFKS